MTGKVMNSHSVMPGGNLVANNSSGLWSFSNLNTLSQHQIPKNAVQQSQTSIGGNNQYSIVKIQTIEENNGRSRANGNPTDNGPKTKEIFHSSSSILNNSALAKATDEIRPQMWFSNPNIDVNGSQ